MSGKSPMRFDLLSASLDGLRAIHDYVRQHNKLGQEWDKDFGTRLIEAILGGGEEDGGHTSAGKDASESPTGDTHQAAVPG